MRRLAVFAGVLIAGCIGRADLPLGVDAGTDVDAGGDAGAFDAGTNDAGSNDGGIDAGVDAGSIDAGIDAGAADSGAGDAGLDGGADAGAGCFVAVGYGGRRLRTADGVTWTDDIAWAPNGGDDPDLLRAVGFGNGGFVAVGYRIATSPNGSVWTDAGTMGQWLGGISYAKGLWVAAGGYGRRAHSVDGVAWVDSASDGITNAFRASTYDSVSQRWVAVGDNGVRMSSGDGVAWSAGDGGASLGFARIASCGGRTIAASGGQVIISANGGLEWSAPVNVGGGANVTGLTCNSTGFLLVGQGKVFSSVDGLSWAATNVTQVQGPAACAGMLCVINDGSKAWRSTNGGGSWAQTATFSIGPQAFESVTYGVP